MLDIDEMVEEFTNLVIRAFFFWAGLLGFLLFIVAPIAGVAYVLSWLFQ